MTATTDATTLRPSDTGRPGLRRVTLYGMTALAALLVGYDLGVMAGAILFIKQDLSLSPAAVGLVVSVVSLASVGTALVAGPLVDRFGRRRMLVAAAVTLTIASLGSAAATSAGMLLAFRVLIGIGTCIATTTVPTYLAELAPARSRGSLTSLYQLMWAIGALVAFLVDYSLASGAQWRLMIGAGAVLALLTAVGLLFQPESPRWLVRQGRLDEARAALAISDPSDVDEVLRELSDSGERTRPGRLSELWADRSLRRVLLFGCGIAALQQLIGINAIVYYAPTILTDMGFGAKTAILNSVGLGVLSVIATLVEIRLIDRVGRRRLMLLGGTLLGLSMVTLAVVFGVGAIHHTTGRVVALVAIAVFKAGFSLSWGPVVWVSLPEIFPLRFRGAGVGAAVLCNGLMNFAVVQVFPSLLVLGPTAVFGGFAFFCVIAVLFAKRLMAELAGQSLEHIASRTFTTTH